jgi:hypothetical protein
MIFVIYIILCWDIIMIIIGFMANIIRYGVMCGRLGVLGGFMEIIVN